jgi:uncharacterized membrane protein YgcG
MSLSSTTLKRLAVLVSLVGTSTLLGLPALALSEVQSNESFTLAQGGGSGGNSGGSGGSDGGNDRN